jgi:cytochrome c oxidase subunit 3
VNFFREITKKPWLTAGSPAEELGDNRAFALLQSTLGLRVLLIAVSVLFSMLVIAYSDRMVLTDWRPMPEPWLLWPNTVLLVFASAAMQWALTSVRGGRMGDLRRGLLAAGVFSLAFLAGQFLAWQELVALGYFAAANPANAFFYLLTAFHGVHLLGGLAALGRTAVKVYGTEDASQMRQSVRLCAVYWHFLFVVWLVLFGLLLFT